MSLKLGNSEYLQEEKANQKSSFACNQDICKTPSQLFRELLHYSHGGSTKTLCSTAACQEIGWTREGVRVFLGIEGSPHDGKIGGEAMPPSHRDRKAVRGQGGNAAQSHALAEQCYSI